MSSSELNGAMESSRSIPTPMNDTAVEPNQDARVAALARRRDRSTPPPSGRPATHRRRHPAKGARIAALGLSLVSTGGLAAVFARAGAGSGTEVQAASIVAVTSASSTARTPSTVVVPTTVPATPATPSTASTEGAVAVVDGSVVRNQYGLVQVEATFASDGSLTAVDVIQAPSRDRKSVQINDRAVPELDAEALSAQSANVDTVSGATYTSNDYRTSLQSAIDAARSAGITSLA